MLPGCLASVRGVVDEIIVADTGSEDGTVALAEEAGARVVHFPWCDDFSAARNASIAAATGDWILVLDADERLGPEAGVAIRAAVRRADFDCGLLPRHDAVSLDVEPEDVLSGVARNAEPILIPRLFRHTEDLAYTGIIHEDVADWIVAGGRAIRRIDGADLVHYGYIPTVWEARGKAERNLKLLEKQCALTPDKPLYRAYLSRELLRVGDGVRAREEIERGWADLQAICARGGPRPAGVAVATARAFFQLQDGDFRAAAETAVAARGLGYVHPNLDLLLGAAREQLALDSAGVERAEHLERAAEAFEAALAADGRAFTEELSPGATSWAASTRLGVVRLLQGRPAEALGCFEAALARSPAFIDARLGRAEALIDSGHPEDAIRALESMMAEERPDPWLLAALACEAMGDIAEVGILAKRAMELVDKGFVSHHRTARLAELSAMCGLYEGPVAEAPPSWAGVVALLSRRPLPAAPAVSPRPSDGQLRTLVLSLLHADRVDLLETLFEARAEYVVPGITALVREVLATLGISAEDDGEPDYLFIGGAGRSGTTLFRAMLAAHPRIHCGPEAKLVPAMCAMREAWWRSMGRDLQEAGVSPQILDDATRGFLDALMKGLGGDSPRIAEKTPHNVVHTETLARLFPRARFIHVVRDGRAVVASLLEQDWMDPSTGERLAYCQDAGAAADYWATVVSEARRQGAGVPGRYMEVRYEELVSDPRGVMERVLAWLGEPWDERVLEHERAGVALSSREASTPQVVNAVHTASLEKWRRKLSPAQQRVVAERAGRVLRALGYVEENAGEALLAV